MKAKQLLLASLACALPMQATHAETVTYTYDARGRLIQAAHAQGPNDGVIVQYAYDAADNRTSASASVAGSSSARLVVVPLNGFTVIPLNN